MTKLKSLDGVLQKVKGCKLCQDILPNEARPIFQASTQSKILIAGQAPGIKAHDKGIPFDDKSGERLRAWLGVNLEQFYNSDLFAILPMGFCYPGKGITGDLPPIPACAQTWRKPLLKELKQVELTIILGKYAIDWHLNSRKSIKELAQDWQKLLQKSKIVLPHPSPRNNLWLKKNPWFEQQVIPVLQKQVHNILHR